MLIDDVSKRRKEMKELNVVSIVPKERHSLIFRTFDELGKGDSFI